MNILLKVTGGLFGVFFSIAAVELYNKVDAVQPGYPGVGMQTLDTRGRLATKAAANVVPPALPPASQDGKLSIDAYKNVQVLGHISSGEMTRLMTAMTNWVAPQDGCAYCHAHVKDAKGNDVKDEEGFAQADLNKMDSDELYTKRVARRMLQMTMRINGEWKEHVKTTGVTCYTCHRGNPVPPNIWFDVPEDPTTAKFMGNRAAQNAPAMSVGLTALPGAPLRPFLVDDENIRIISTQPVDSPNRASIKQAEWTYGLMMHFSSALGVNCTHCHNTRSMGEWSVSPPTRAQAWFGIRLTRELNKDFLEPLISALPTSRLGALGDAPKANCATCHAGAYRPLLGVSMLTDYQVLAEAKPQPAKTPEPTAVVPADAADGGATATAALGDGGAASADGGVAGGDAGAPTPAGAKGLTGAKKPGRPAAHP